MIENLRQQFETLPENLANHLVITVIPLVLGGAISLPLAVLIVRRPRLRYPALTIVSVIQTIPSLALLALMVPVLAALGVLTTWAFGFEVSALGFYPSVIALTLYSMLPMVRNAVTGITGVDPAMVEAARGVGMTDRQMLLRVQLPLAAPVIIAGVRTATVWVVGIATLATPVGQRCLGNYIFQGLQTRNWIAVLFGCVVAAALAITLDLLLGGVEKAVRDRRRRLGAVCGAFLGIVFVGGVIAPAIADARRSEAIVVGAKNFTEQFILSTAVESLLEDAGMPVRRSESLGSTVVFDLLAQGEIDVYIDYSGTIWANYMQRDRADDRDAVRRETARWLLDEHGIVVLGELGFENAYGIAVRGEDATALDLRAIGDLAPHAPEWVIGGDIEFFVRPEWAQIRDPYDLFFAEERTFDSTFMYEALRQGDVDVIAAFTTEGRIGAYGLRVLDDPLQTIPPYDAVILLSGEAAANEAIVSALEPLVGAVSVEIMREANFMVDRDDDKRTVGDAASWLLEQAIGREAFEAR